MDEVAWQLEHAVECDATAYMDSIAASFGANLPAGMRRIAAAIAEAEARVGGPG